MGDRADYSTRRLVGVLTGSIGTQDSLLSPVGRARLFTRILLAALPNLPIAVVDRWRLTPDQSPVAGEGKPTWSSAGPGPLFAAPDRFSTT
jgi:hypothetical protein